MASQTSGATRSSKEDAISSIATASVIESRASSVVSSTSAIAFRTLIGSGKVHDVADPVDPERPLDLYFFPLPREFLAIASPMT